MSPLQKPDYWRNLPLNLYSYRKCLVYWDSSLASLLGMALGDLNQQQKVDIAKALIPDLIGQFKSGTWPISLWCRRTALRQARPTHRVDGRYVITARSQHIADVMAKADESTGDVDLEETAGNAIELAIVGQAKRFIKSAACQKVISKCLPQTLG